jgi:hypothetical protein
MKYILLSLIFLTGCMQSRVSTSSVGTLVSVSSIDGKACDFGTIKIQPAEVGGSILEVHIGDMNSDKKAMLSKYIGKKVKLSVTEEGRFGCQTSLINIEDFHASN